MNAHSLKTVILGSTIAVAGASGLAAHAGEVASARHADVVVRYADLDLNSSEGAKTLYARLSAAAERACGNESGARDLGARLQYQACVERALEKAVGKVGNAGVQAVHAVRKGPAAVG